MSGFITLGLKKAGEAMRIASLDLGSNTTLMLIADVSENGIHVIRDFSTVTRMGQEISQTGRIHQDALVRIDNCLSEYSAEIKRRNVEKVVAVATSAARDASNSSELIQLTEKYEIPVSVVSGEKEAEITFSGSTFDQPDPDHSLVVDIGGGSTELVGRESEGGLIRGKSLNIGSVRLLDMFLARHPVPESDLLQAMSFVDENLVQSLNELSFAKGKSAVAVAGTPTTLAMLTLQSDYDEDKIHQFKISKGTVEVWFRKLANLSVEERRQLPGMPEKRADVMVAGCLILSRVMEKLGFEELVVSTKGVRYGLALEEFKKGKS